MALNKNADRNLIINIYHIFKGFDLLKIKNLNINISQYILQGKAKKNDAPKPKGAVSYFYLNLKYLLFLYR